MTSEDVFSRPPRATGGSRERPPLYEAAAPVSYSASASVDFFTAQAGYVARRPQPSFNQFTVGRPLSSQPAVLPWELRLSDLSGGLDQMTANIDQGFVPNSLSFSDLEHRFPRTLCLLPLEESFTSSDVQAGPCFGLGAGFIRADTSAVFMTVGVAAGKALFVGGFTGPNVPNPPLGDPFLAAVPEYTPPSLTLGLYQLEIGGTGTQRLGIGHRSHPVWVLSANSIDGQMHSSTSACWGIIISPLNAETPGAGTLLIYAGNKMLTLSTTAAMGDTPTTVLTGVPGGGFPLGIVQLPGGPVRAYWVMPLKNLADSMLAPDITVPARVFSTNLEGTDRQVLDMGLDFVSDAKVYRSGIVAHDGQRIIWHNGRKNDLTALRERYHAALGRETQTSVVALAPVEERLFAAFCETNAAGDVIARWWEEFIPELGTWYKAARRKTLTGYPAVPFLRVAAGHSTVLHHFNNLHGTTGGHRLFWYQPSFPWAPVQSTEGWYTIGLLPGQTNPFYWQNQGEIIRRFEPEGYAETPVYSFHGDLPKVISEVWCGGELVGPSSMVTITQAVETQTGFDFSKGLSFVYRESGARIRRNVQLPTNSATFQRLALRITITRSPTEDRTTPNALPIVIRGYTFLDRVPRQPVDIEPWRFA